MHLKTALCLALCTGVAACVQDLAGYTPTGPFHYPMDAVASQTQPLIYVLNSNFDQRFNGGSVSVLRVDAQEGLQTQPDGGVLVQKILIPSMGAQMALDTLNNRIAVSHRGMGFITLLDINPSTGLLSCGVSSGDRGSITQEQERSECDSAHFINLKDTGVYEEVSQVLDVYPLAFTSHFAQPQSYLEAGFLSTGSVWQGLLSAQGPSLQSASSLGLGGAVSLVSLVQHPASQGREVTAAGRWSDGSVFEAALFTYRKGETSADATHTRTVRIAAQWAGTLVGDVVFAPHGLRAYVVTQNPGALLTLDTQVASLKDDGGAVGLWPRMQVLHVLPLNGRPMDVKVFEQAGQTLLAVANFEQDKVSFFHVSSGVPKLLADVPVGSGAMAVAPVLFEGQTYVAVTGFIDHSVSVVKVLSAASSGVTFVKKVRNETIPLGDR